MGQPNYFLKNSFFELSYRARALKRLESEVADFEWSSMHAD